MYVTLMKLTFCSFLNISEVKERKNDYTIDTIDAKEEW